jgi:hypothetical protein
MTHSADNNTHGWLCWSCGWRQVDECPEPPYRQVSGQSGWDHHCPSCGATVEWEPHAPEITETCGTCLHHESGCAYCGLMGARRRGADLACREWVSGAGGA